MYIHSPSEGISPREALRQTSLGQERQPYPEIKLSAALGDSRGGDWQGREDSNPRPAVLETAALPTELHPCTDISNTPGASRTHDTRFRKPLLYPLSYRGPNGDRGIRTPDLCDANAALSQLSYIPRTKPGRGPETFFGKLDFNGSVITMSRNPGDARPSAKENRRRHHPPNRYST